MSITRSHFCPLDLREPCVSRVVSRRVPRVAQTIDCPTVIRSIGVLYCAVLCASTIQIHVQLPSSASFITLIFARSVIRRSCDSFVRSCGRGERVYVYELEFVYLGRYIIDNRQEHTNTAVCCRNNYWIVRAVLVLRAVRLLPRVR